MGHFPWVLPVPFLSCHGMMLLGEVIGGACNQQKKLEQVEAEDQWEPANLGSSGKRPLNGVCV